MFSQPNARGGWRKRVEATMDHQRRLHQTRYFCAQVCHAQQCQPLLQRFGVAEWRVQKNCAQLLHQRLLSRHTSRLQTQKSQQRGLRVVDQIRTKSLQVR